MIKLLDGIVYSESIDIHHRSIFKAHYWFLGVHFKNCPETDWLLDRPQEGHIGQMVLG